MKKILFLLLALFIAIPSYAVEEVKVCGKYQRADGTWSQEYKLTGFTLRGSELEKMLKYSRDIYSWEKYFIIVWDQGGYTYYKVESYFPNSFMTRYLDQNSRAWEFKEGWSYCY